MIGSTQLARGPLEIGSLEKATPVGSIGVFFYRFSIISDLMAAGSIAGAFYPPG
jgi:hypothetical protein